MSNTQKKNVESARRFLWDEDEDLAPRRAAPAATASTTTGGSRPFSTRDSYSVDQSVNLMALGDQQPHQQQQQQQQQPHHQQQQAARPTIRETVSGLFRGGGPAVPAPGQTNLSGATSLPTAAAAAAAPRFDEYGDAAASGESEEYIGNDKHRRRMSPLFASLINCWNSTMDAAAVSLGRMNHKTLAFWMCLVCGLVVSSLAIVAFLTSSNRDSPTTRMSQMRDYILDSGVTPSAEILDHADSPQQMALQWLAKEDLANLETDHPFLIERYALAVLYFSTGGTTNRWETADNWLSAKGICMWYGIECIPIDIADPTKEDTTSKVYDDNAPVITIKLTANKMEGELPIELAGFSNLITLDLSQNELSGNVPTELGNLPVIRYLYLRQNVLVGTLPTQIGKLTTLHDLHLGENGLDGTIPLEIATLVQLRAFGIDQNLFTGSVPALAGLSRLAILYLDDNRLVGKLPDYLDKLTGLVDFRLKKNSFTGTIPATIKDLKSLEVFQIDNNGFTGTIPDTFDHTTHLRDIQLHENKFSGTIPPTLGDLRGLKRLYLDHNALTGTIPARLGFLADVEAIYFDNNKLTGSIPSMLGYLDDIKELRLNNNALNGSFPSELGSCFRLINLNVDHNQLTGEIPTQFGNLDTLENFRLYSNSFEGITMPPQVCGLVTNEELTFLAADCTSKVTCECCHKCF